MTGQNRSTAVMQRRVEPHASLDDFPTPPWATRAVCEKLQAYGVDFTSKTCREPCANRGYMVRPLAEYFATVVASDVHDYGAGFAVRDYLFALDGDEDAVHWTFMNPPFRLALEFILTALRQSREGVVVIVRGAFLEGIGRYRDLYCVHRPWLVLYSAERIPMVKGRYDPDASTATQYVWLIFRNDTDEVLPPDWIAPCRERLERAGDVMWESVV